MKFLCHAGPWSDAYFSYLVKEMYPSAKCDILSGHKKVDKSGLCDIYYEEVAKNKNNTYEITEEDLDIIARCRLLRALKINEALLHVNCMRKAICETLSILRPDIVLTETIDSYIMDLLNIESKKRNIPCIGLVTAFVNGCYRVSIRGEYVKSRNVTAEEVDVVLNDLLSKEYLPSFVVNSKQTIRYNAIKNWTRNLIKIPYFFLKRIFSEEKYNYHYWQAHITSAQLASFIPVIDPGEYKYLEKLKGTQSTVIYVPLQMFPEATIDYWCSSRDIIDYECILVDFIKKHKNINFLIKEHPNVVGYRSRRFYKRLKSCENVIFCPTYVQSNSLLNYYDAVLVWTGSVGFESAIRDKPVLCASRPYYFPESFNCLIFSMSTSTVEIQKFIEDYYNDHASINQKELVRYLLEGCLEGRVRFDGSWCEENDEQVVEVKKLSTSLKAYIEKI